MAEDLRQKQVAEVTRVTTLLLCQSVDFIALSVKWENNLYIINVFSSIKEATLTTADSPRVKTVLSWLCLCSILP